MLNHLIALFRHETLYKTDLCARDCFYYLEIKHFNLRNLFFLFRHACCNIVGYRLKHDKTSGLYRLNHDLVNIHCFEHILELAFRDVVNLSKLYDQQMALLIGLRYFYINTLRISTVLWKPSGLLSSYERFSQNIWNTVGCTFRPIYLLSNNNFPAKRTSSIQPFPHQYKRRRLL